MIDGMRAIAALMVVVFHVAQEKAATDASFVGGLLSAMSSAVAIFFVISGFLLYRPYVAARWSAAPPIRARDYLRRRLLRIVPAYWLALTVLAVYPGLRDMFTARSWIYYLFGQVYGANTIFGGLPQAWSLSVEMSFYVALPGLAAAVTWFLRRRRSSERTRDELVLLGVLGVGSLIITATVYRGGPQFVDHYWWITSTIFGVFLWFALGMICATLSVATHERAQRIGVVAVVACHPTLVVVAAAGFFIMTSVGVAHHAPTVVEYALEGAFAVSLFAPAVFGAAGWYRRALGLRAISWLGLISYGVFLWHAPLIAKLDGLGVSQGRGVVGITTLSALTIGASVVAAAISYYVVERPILRYKR